MNKRKHGTTSEISFEVPRAKRYLRSDYYINVSVNTIVESYVVLILTEFGTGLPLVKPLNVIVNRTAHAV